MKITEHIIKLKTKKKFVVIDIILILCLTTYSTTLQYMYSIYY